MNWSCVCQQDHLKTVLGTIASAEGYVQLGSIYMKFYIMQTGQYFVMDTDLYSRNTTTCVGMKNSRFIVEMDGGALQGASVFLVVLLF